LQSSSSSGHLVLILAQPGQLDNIFNLTFFQGLALKDLFWPQASQTQQVLWPQAEQGWLLQPHIPHKALHATVDGIWLDLWPWGQHTPVLATQGLTSLKGEAVRCWDVITGLECTKEILRSEDITSR